MTVSSINSGTRPPVPVSPLERCTVADRIFETSIISNFTPIEEISKSLVEGGALKGGVTVFNAVKDSIIKIVPKKRKGEFGENLYKILLGDKQITSQVEHWIDFEKSPFKKFSFSGSVSITLESCDEKCMKIAIIDNSTKQRIFYVDKNSCRAYKHPFSLKLTKEEALQKLENLLKTVEVMVAVFNRHGVAAFCREKEVDNSFYKYNLHWINSQKDFGKSKKARGLCQSKKVRKIGSSRLTNLDHEGFRCVPFSSIQIYQLIACSEDVNFKYEHQIEENQSYKNRLNGEEAEVIYLQEGFLEKLRISQEKDTMDDCLDKRSLKFGTFF